MIYPKRIRIEHPHVWKHHQRGWKYVIELLKFHLHSPGGIKFISSVDDAVVNGEIVKEPWVGFLHQVPDTQGRWFPDLGRLFASSVWRENLRYCKGLFVLSEYVRKFVMEQVKNVPVCKLYYPAAPARVTFDSESFKIRERKRLIHIGQYLRNYQAFYDLEAPEYEKVLLHHHGVNTDQINTNDSVAVVRSLSPQDYDNIFSDSVIFLNLKDASANTTLVECIAANTPILVNRVGGVAEYLGDEYPLYYVDLEEASRKAAELELVTSASHYLKTYSIKALLAKRHFLDSFVASEVYRTLTIQ